MEEVQELRLSEETEMREDLRLVQGAAVAAVAAAAQPLAAAAQPFATVALAALALATAAQPAGVR